MNPRAFLRDLLNAALRRADPLICLPPHLPTPPKGRTVVVGAGKAAATMARAVEAHWPADAPLTGLVVTRYGHTLPAVPHQRIEVVEAAHPVPDEAGVAAAQRILALVRDLTPDDLVIALLSGGGSALLAAPAPGITLAHKRELTRALLASGASISEINTVRRHLSAIKGGRLALAAQPAQLLTLAISDVPGDALTDIASGPSVPDHTTPDEARAICVRYGLDFPDVSAKVSAGDTALLPVKTHAHLICTAADSLRAAADVARAAGITPVILGDRIEGEAREVARVLAGIAISCAEHGTPALAPCVLLSGGETTVTVKNPAGQGGRNSEFLLALAIALKGHPRIHALAADTDGIDGSEDNAGAFMSPDTLARMQAIGLNPCQILDKNMSYSAYAALGDLIHTGPTRTNVNDFRAILIL
jgi:glycerate 2-kinase